MFFKLFSFALLLLAGLVVPASAASLPTDRFPDLPLAGTGLDDATTPSTTLQELPFQVLVVEIFSMYCPHCQREAPAVNELHDILKARHPLGRVGLVGIGAGNTPYEVDIFRKKFTIEFPLFPDADYAWHKALGQPPTPHFFVLAKNGESLAILLSHEGPFGDVQSFADRIAESAKPVLTKE